MKIKISRHQIYVIIMTLVLLLSVILFAFLALIPEGKEYREKRIALKKEQKNYKRYENFHNETLARLKELQSQNRHIITAFGAIFDPQRFERLYKNYFSSLKLSKLSRRDDEDGFAVYEVNTTSHINSPKNFYDFLDALNKGEWIIGVNFPISFVRDGEMIRSSFTMKVYANNKDKNASASGSSKR